MGRAPNYVIAGAMMIGLLIFCIAWPRAHELSAPDINESKTLSYFWYFFSLVNGLLILLWTLLQVWRKASQRTWSAFIIFQTQLSLIILAQIFNELCRDLGISNALNAAFVGIIFIGVSQMSIVTLTIMRLTGGTDYITIA